MATKAKGGKNRKYGRGKRSPSNISYNTERRDLSNARKRQARDARRVAKKAAKLANRASR